MIRRLAASGLTLLTLACLAPASATLADAAPPSIRGLKLFDAGTADVDGDLDLDLYTVNHSYRGSMLINDGAGDFGDDLYGLGLGQDSQFPGLESQGAPTLDDPGVYLDLENRILRVRGHELDRDESLTIRFHAPSEVSKRFRASARVRRKGRGSIVHLRLENRSDVKLSPQLVALPIRVKLLRELSPAETFIGSQAVSPVTSRFNLTLRDRHAIAWADIDGDGTTDAFIARGGLKGQLGSYRGLADDELLIGDGGTFENRYGDSGLVKGACRARSAAAVDFDRDGRLDLFEGCEGTSPRLYRQLADGTYRNVSRFLREAGLEAGAFQWFDLDADGTPELIAAQREWLSVYAEDAEGWTRIQHERVRNARPARSLVIADYDNDGDPDGFIAAPSGNTLFVNRAGALHAKDPRRSGLPGSSGLAAAWVDYDNDGLSDLEIQPRGLYRQGPAGEFHRGVGPRAGGNAVGAVSAWPDTDSNGARDSMLAWRPRGERDWQSSLTLQDGPAGNWLEFDPSVAGTDTLGARIEVTAGGVTQTRWVGESESSLRSQGHYRVYFGLGDETETEAMVVWPDGSEQQLGALSANQLVELSP